MKINIFIDINPFFQNSASGNRWRTLIEGLKELNVNIKLYILTGYQSIKEKDSLGIKGIYKGIEYEYLSSGSQFTLWQRRIHKYIGSYISNYTVKRKIIKIVRKDQESIYWTSNSLLGFEIATVIKSHNSQIKTFLEMSEYLDIHRFNKGNKLQFRNGEKRQNYFEQKAIDKYDGIALMTSTLMKHYKGFSNFKGKLLHLPMTVDLKRFNKTYGVPKGFEPPYIAFVGVMNDKKEGVSILINSFSTITQLYPKLKLYLIGAWNYDTPIHIDLIKKLKLEGRVFYKGEYERDSIPSIISNAEVLVLPRPNSKQAQGGFPTKLGEYLATGKPVCATPVGELPLYLADNESVYFAEPDSVESFSNAIQRVLSDKTKSKSVGENGRHVAFTYFNKDKQSIKLYNFLKTL